MEHLFTVSLKVKEQESDYDVFFDKEVYHFHADGRDHDPRSFHLKREHDEWHSKDLNEPDLSHAADVLDKYLLKQH